MARWLPEIDSREWDAELQRALGVSRSWVDAWVRGVRMDRGSAGETIEVRAPGQREEALARGRDPGT
jgi:hypothetical protein